MSLGLGSNLSKSGLATPGIVTDSLVLKHKYEAGAVVPVSDGAALACGQSAGFKGLLRCNGALISSENAADEVEIVVSADPGAATLELKLEIIAKEQKS